MKKLLLLLGFGCALSHANAQDSQIVERGADYRVVENILQTVTEEGDTILTTNRHTEMSTGMHFWTKSEWKESNPRFKLVPGFAVADEVQHRFTLSANINEEGAVVMETPDGKIFRSTPLLLAFRDTETGEAIGIASLQDSIGEQISPDQIFYPSALQGVACGIRYSVRKGGIEQELIIQEPLNPEEWGLRNVPSVRLELWTAFYESPALQSVTEVDAGDMRDIILDFGAVQIGQGKTFAIESKGSEAPVAKRFGPLEGDARLFLVEMISQPNLRPLMDALQQAKAGKPQEKVKRLAIKKAHSDKELLAGMGKVGHDKKKEKKKDVAMMSRTDRQLGPGVVLDYSTLNGATGSYTFASDTTTYINGNTTFSSGSLVTFEGGSVLKYTNDVKLTLNCPISWGGSPYRPVIMTSVSDHSIGEKLNNAALSGQYALAALELNASTAGADMILKYFNIRHAQVGIILNGRTGHKIDHGQFVSCGYGIKLLNSATTLARNILFANTTTNLSGSGCTVRAEHITSGLASYFMSDLANCFLTNSLLAGVTTVGTLTSSEHVATPSSTNGLFQPSQSGRHYLADNTYRNIGISGVSILAEIARKTTYPPMTLAGSLAVNTTLVPVVSRDNDSLLDYGYHYEVIDVLAKESTLYSTLSLSGGVVVGVAGAYGLNLQGGSSILSEGRADTLNRLVKYNTVQECTNILDASSSTFGFFKMTSSATPRPDISLRFTEISCTADVAARMRLLDASSGGYTTYSPNQIRLKDSKVLNAGLYLYPDTSGMPISFTNCLFERSGITLADGSFGSLPIDFRAQNASFIKGSVSLIHSASTYTWNIYDTLFETTTLTTSGSVAISNGRNGYKTTAVLAGTAGNDQVLTTVDFQAGPLGNFYYNTTAGTANTYYLINKDTITTPATVGLFYHTTRPDQASDGATPTGQDIGFHYVATQSSVSTLPVDTDGDGVPDYLEDANGNHILESGETDWLSAFDLGLRVRITEPKSNSNVP